MSARTKRYMHAAIIIALMTLFGFLPPIGSLTPFGMKVMGIFIGCIYAWIIGEIIWPSFLAIVLIGFFEGNTVTGVFASAVGNATMHMVMITLVFCYGIEKSGMMEVIARFIVSRKFAQKGPWWLAFTFWLASAVVSLITLSAIAVPLILWAIFYSVAEKIGLEKKSPYVTVVLFGVAMFAYLGVCIVPYQPFTQITLGLVKAFDPTTELNFIAYALSNIVITAVALPVLIAFCKYVLRIKVDYSIPENLIEAGNLSLTGKQKLILVYVVALSLMLILPSYLPAELLLTQVLNKFGFTGTFVLMSILMAISYDSEGKEIMEIGDSLAHVPWSLVCIVATALTIAGYITNPATGITTMLTDVFSPLLANRSAFVLIAIVGFAGLVLTNLINNIVCVTLLAPIALGFLGVAGGNPGVLFTIMAVALYQGLVTPSGSVLGAMVHGNTEWMTGGGIYRYGTLLELVLGIVIVVVGVPVTTFFYGIF